MAHDSLRSQDPATKPLAVLVPAANTHSQDTRVWGLSLRERLIRGLEIAGARVAERDGEGLDERALYLRTDHVYDERVLGSLLAAHDDLLLCSDQGAVAASASAETGAAALEALRGGPRSGFREVAPSDLATSFDATLRRRSEPYAIAVEGSAARRVENRLFRAAYKTATDAVTKWVWPLPARGATRWCVRRGIRPNAVTAVSYVLAAAVPALWAFGFFAAGLVLAWWMTFLDTVDGKLARVTLRSSRLGQILDHGLDLVHPPIWWAAWAWGLAGGAPDWGTHLLTMWVVVGGYVVGRLLEGVFLLAFGMEMFIWRRFDTGFRLVIARRNPNLVLLSVAVVTSQPDAGLFAVAIWTAASVAIQLARIGRALQLRQAGNPIETWFEEPRNLES